MSVEEIKSNGVVKQENLSSVEGLLTYMRKKRKRPVPTSCQPEDTNFSAAKEVSHVISGDGKGKDFGWEHGEMVEGNRYHWKCNWCNYVGRSGGVTRLKKHLAGGWHVRSCGRVPTHIARTMNLHLIELRKKKRMKEGEDHDIIEMNSENLNLDASAGTDHGRIGSGMRMKVGIKQSRGVGEAAKTDSIQLKDPSTPLKFATQDLDTDMPKVGIASKRFKTISRRKRCAVLRSQNFCRQSDSGTQQSKIDMVEDKEEPYERILYAKSYDEGDLPTADCHWRSILQHLLQLPDIREGGGMQRSINDALAHALPDYNGKSKMDDVFRDTAEPKDGHNNHSAVSGQSPRPDTPTNARMDVLENVSETETFNQTDAVTNKLKCQDALVHLLTSDKFVSLCNLLCENFQVLNVEKVFDINQINSKMRNGVYGKSPGLFDEDVQKIWRKIQKVGEEMVLLASSLLNMSEKIDHKQVGDDLVKEACAQKCEENHQVCVVPKNPSNSDFAMQFPSCESDSSTKADQTEASGLYKVCTCKQCGSEADGERSLICDHCEAVYHFSCVEPSVQEIPTKSWYCAFCAKDRRKSSESPVNNTRQESLHDNCVVCERLEVSQTKEKLNVNGSGIGTATTNESREGSVSSRESEEPPEPSRTALSHLCKQCGTCEDEDRRFLVCGHNQCPYKYYHIRCLKSSQIASLQQQGRDCWYCPSCLCRACFHDRDDDKIVLCDGCDEAYHTYCMKPPRTSIPKGQWYCLQCNVAKAKEGMRRYEQWILQQHGKKDVRQADEANRSMDMLLSAVEKLSSEENLAAGRKEKD